MFKGDSGGPLFMQIGHGHGPGGARQLGHRLARDRTRWASTRTSGTTSGSADRSSPAARRRSRRPGRRRSRRLGRRRSRRLGSRLRRPVVFAQEERAAHSKKIDEPRARCAPGLRRGPRGPRVTRPERVRMGPDPRTAWSLPRVILALRAPCFSMLGPTAKEVRSPLAESLASSRDLRGVETSPDPSLPTPRPILPSPETSYEAYHILGEQGSGGLVLRLPRVRRSTARPPRRAEGTARIPRPGSASSLSTGGDAERTPPASCRSPRLTRSERSRTDCPSMP